MVLLFSLTVVSYIPLGQKRKGLNLNSHLRDKVLINFWKFLFFQFSRRRRCWHLVSFSSYLMKLRREAARLHGTALLKQESNLLCSRDLSTDSWCILAIFYGTVHLLIKYISLYVEFWSEKIQSKCQQICWPTSWTFQGLYFRTAVMAT